MEQKSPRMYPRGAEEVQPEENQESYESKSNGLDEEEVEESTIHKVQTVSDGSNHKHIWIEDYTDNEGKIHLQCSKCFQGSWKQKGK